MEVYYAILVTLSYQDAGQLLFATRMPNTAVMMTHRATATRTVLTRATGNLPTTSAYCTVKYRVTPRKSVHRPMMIMVAPSGREYLVSCWFWSPAIVKSCTSAANGRSDCVSGYTEGCKTYRRP